VTKDVMMATFISPAKSDPKEDGLVQSVSEKGKKTMLGLVSWQPSGSIVAGAEYLPNADQKQYRVIFWEKNGLRHLEFSLKYNIIEVVSLFWSLDSSILFVRVKSVCGDKLLVYYRANYHWFLKSVISLQPDDFCLSLSC
jgi:elongator complex protein 1